MKESGYYPMGAEFDKNAPFNQEDIPDREFETTISQTLIKEVKVDSNNYYIEDEEVYIDNKDLLDAYKIQHHTPLELIKFFKEKLVKEYKELGEVSDEPLLRKKKMNIKFLINECEGWEEEDIRID